MPDTGEPRARASAAPRPGEGRHNLQDAQTLLRRLHNEDQVRLLSLSMDAAHDTPARLAEVASGYEAKPQLWTFASASEEQMRPFAAAAGLQFSQVNNQIVHNRRTVVLDGEGCVRRIFRGKRWAPAEFVGELRVALTKLPQSQAASLELSNSR